MTRPLIVALLLASGRADDDASFEFDGHMSEHASSDVCQACYGDIVFPNNGSATPIFKACFAAVDEVCSDERSQTHSFCRVILAEPDPDESPREPGDEHGMLHVVEVRVHEYNININAMLPSARARI